MIIWILKTFFGKLIGLDKIPEDKKQQALELVVKALESSKVSYNPSTGEVAYEMRPVKKEF